MSKKQLIIFFSVMAIITGVAIWKASELENYAGVVQAWVTVVLVLVTAAYAYNIKRQTDANVEMTKSAKEQTEVSIKMATEIRNQRYSESMPLLVPEIPNIDNAKNPNDAYLRLQSSIDVIWKNHGRGAAINAEFFFQWNTIGRLSDSTYCMLSTIGIEKSKAIRFENTWIERLQSSEGHSRPRLIAKYYDIYEREITTVQELDIVREHNTYKTHEESTLNKELLDENSVSIVIERGLQEDRAFRGDIYFTINGKRLKKEAAK